MNKIEYFSFPFSEIDFIPVTEHSVTKLNLWEKSGSNTERYTPRKIARSTMQNHNDTNANPFRIYSTLDFL